MVTLFPVTEPLFINSTSSAVVRFTAVEPLLVPSFGVMIMFIWVRGVPTDTKLTNIVSVGLAAAAKTSICMCSPFLLAAEVAGKALVVLVKTIGVVTAQEKPAMHACVPVACFPVDAYGIGA